MRRSKLLSLVVLGSVAAVANAAAAQEQSGDGAVASKSREAPGEPDIVVQGRRLGQRLAKLRVDLELAEDAVYARFNEINSDDRFDIHCREQSVYFSHSKQRVCQSNSFHEQDANMGEAAARTWQGDPGSSIERGSGAGAWSEQQRMQKLLREEMVSLSLRDEALHQAIKELGDKQLEYEKVRGRELADTRERELRSVEGDLPFGAQRVFEVKIGRDPWSQALTQPTFAITLFSGEIRTIDVACDGHSKDLEFAADVEWTLPDDWSACILTVRAQEDTTFALYQF
ncbi:MAG TPA: hypothetical protein VFX89_05730 [Gammaproteobacteria bacterium]|nr:hypothetical protein [Gammaproteobacteria bacterium]